MNFEHYKVFEMLENIQFEWSIGDFFYHENLCITLNYVEWNVPGKCKMRKFKLSKRSTSIVLPASKVITESNMLCALKLWT